MKKTLTLKPGREKALLRKHPWVFSGAVQHVTGDPEPGETVAVQDPEGRFLAWAAYSPQSQIRARVWSWDPHVEINRAFFAGKIRQARAMRAQWVDPEQTTACRLIHGESDGLPGLIADHYGDTLAVQILSAGAERWRDTLVDILAEQAQPNAIYERSDVAVRALEGLPGRTGLLFGALPERTLTIRENGLAFKVDLVGGQKTGFYLDQRDNRRFCREIAQGKKVVVISGR